MKTLDSNPLTISCKAVCCILQAISEKIKRRSPVTEKDWAKLKQQIKEVEASLDKQ